MDWSASKNFRGHVMTRLNDGEEIKLTMALAAWRSFSRLQQETDYWRNLLEQRVANLSEVDKEEFHRLKDPGESVARVQHISLRNLTIR